MCLVTLVPHYTAVHPHIHSTIDHFTGAGGLDEGLWQSGGAAETKVAVEFERLAVQLLITLTHWCCAMKTEQR